MPSIALPKVRSMITPISPSPNRPGDASKQQNLLAAYAMLHNASALGVQKHILHTPLQNAYLILGIFVWPSAAGVLTQVGTTILK